MISIIDFSILIFDLNFDLNFVHLILHVGVVPTGGLPHDTACTKHCSSERTCFDRVAKCSARAVRLVERQGVNGCVRILQRCSQQPLLRQAIGPTGAQDESILLSRCAQDASISLGCWTAVDQGKLIGPRAIRLRLTTGPRTPNANLLRLATGPRKPRANLFCQTAWPRTPMANLFCLTDGPSPPKANELHVATGEKTPRAKLFHQSPGPKAPMKIHFR